ncbi:MAG: Rubrerythrin [Candidatus Atribacteria bacterium ADurb.Bin276]|jgi:rubrerythrin|uniref:Rubrerythrin n=2 Tax=Atribacter TaxID=2847777 RepID=A0A1V5SS00_9BACT|nr:MAG: Rubrerythrin [Candidatus Atribacteria bacterium ADurb.Bin276]
MAMRFSADEVLEMAVELERRGIAFYENLSKKTSDQKSREIFIFLGEEEKKHLEYFQKTKDDLNTQIDFVPDTMDETSNYLGSLIENGVLGKILQGLDLTQGDSSIEKALEVGMEVEKESVKFYESMEIMVPESKKEWLKKVIQEEKKHYAILLGIKKELGK